MSYTRRIVRGTAVYFIFSIVAAGISYLFRLLLAKKLSPEEYGLFFGIMAFLGIFTLVKAGFGTTLAKFIPEYIIHGKLDKVREMLRTSLFMLLLLSLIFVTAITFSSSFLTDRYFNRFSALPSSDVRLAIVLFSIMLFLTDGHVIVKSILQGFQKIDQLSLINLVRTAAILVLTFVFLQWGWGVLAPVAGTLLGIFLVIVIFYMVAVRFLPRPFDGRISRDMMRKVTMFTVPVIFGAFGGALVDNTNSLVLVFFRGLKDVAVYNVVFPTSMLTWYFPQALAVVMLPLSSEMWVKKDGRLRKGMELIHRYAFAMILPMALVMVAYPEVMLKLLFGTGYVAGANALRVFAVASVIYSIALLNITLLTGIGRPELTSVIVLCGSALCLALDLILVRVFGVMGAAISTLASFGVMVLISTWMIGKYIKVNIPVAAWLRTAFIGCIFLALIRGLTSLLHLNVIAEIVVSVAVAGVIYIAGLFLLGVVRLEEIPMVR